MNDIATKVEDVSKKFCRRLKHTTLYGVADIARSTLGFHPMLTRRENIYINGAILGMGKREVDKKFKRLVDFPRLPMYTRMYCNLVITKL